ncbi:hypothetical protein AB0G82_36245 [Streptomyces anulatus]|uniref:hypothetical protein n=1 Tax=Streptomyces anulatus TaxID=1892 RepID=UPI0033D2D3A5
MLIPACQHRMAPRLAPLVRTWCQADQCPSRLAGSVVRSRAECRGNLGGEPIACRRSPAISSEQGPRGSTHRRIPEHPSRHCLACPRADPLSKGVNPIAKAKAVDGHRRPVVLIRSSPWKTGTVETPWHDVLDLDNGHVRYYGDG